MPHDYISNVWEATHDSLLTMFPPLKEEEFDFIDKLEEQERETAQYLKDEANLKMIRDYS